MQRFLVTRRVLGRRRMRAKDEIAQASADRDGSHHPAVVRHEDKPGRVRTQQRSTVTGRNEAQEHLHDHKGVKVLDAVQDRLDNVGTTRRLGAVLACPNEGGCLSNVSGSSSTGGISATVSTRRHAGNADRESDTVLEAEPEGRIRVEERLTRCCLGPLNH